MDPMLLVRYKGDAQIKCGDHRGHQAATCVRGQPALTSST